MFYFRYFCSPAFKGFAGPCIGVPSTMRVLDTVITMLVDTLSDWHLDHSVVSAEVQLVILKMQLSKCDNCA